MKLQHLKSYGHRITDHTRKWYSTVQEEVNSYYSENSSEDQDLKDRLKEKNISHQLLWVSLIAFVSKATYYLAQQGWMTTVLSILGYFFSLPVLMWANMWSIYGMAFPLLSGMAMTVITWYTVFLDSYIPGVYTAFPLMLKKDNLGSLHIHVGYIVAAANGVTVAVLMYLGSNNVAT